MKTIQTFCIRTYGCQMNELDSEVMKGMLETRGLTRTDDENTADLLIFNTCSVRDLAERKALGKVGKIGRSRKDRPVIGITGCMATAKKEKLLEKLPHIDFVLGTNNLHCLNDVLDQVLIQGRRVVQADATFSTELDYTVAQRDDPVKACVSIIRGCNKHCTYCIVPYTRGPEVSRAPDDIVDECRRLVEKGYREICLLGQNVNSYGKDRHEWSTLFHDLLYRLDAIPNLARIRFLTSHPVDISKELMQAVRDLPSVCEFVHFPLQAGSNRILHKMHRIYTREEYEEKVASLREIVPGVALGTDIIVGFPTESDEEFEQTCHAMQTIRFSTAFLFAYSPRKGTPSSRWKDDVPNDVKEQRLQRLLELQESISYNEMQSMLHTTAEVLVEAKSFKDSTMVKGRTRTWKNVVFPGSEELIGTIQQVKLHSFTHQTFIGERSLTSV
jgi:tRNA-2-methylthio-N6-dimethylallyladenosine synthase